MKDKPYNYGGQAVIEGVMMRGKDIYALAVRTPEKTITIEKKDISSAQRMKFLKLPIIRGIVAFVDSLVLGLKIITRSAEIAGTETDNQKPTKKSSESLNSFMMFISVTMGIALSIGLFILLPTWVTGNAGGIFNDNKLYSSIFEGVLRIAIFVGYVFLVATMKDVKRVFQYHGAEHKTINCYEQKQALSVDNVMANSRLHKRCGTSFLILVMLVSMVAFMFIRTDDVWLKFGYRLLLLPLIAGFSYELIKWAGNSDSFLVRAISYPGICLQRITTAEPDASQCEVAIAALNEVLQYENCQNAESCSNAVDSQQHS